MMGCRYALSTVVEKRSNSRYSATTSAEQDTGNLGYRPFAASATARSWEGLRYAWSRHTAIASAPAATAASSARSTHAAARDAQRLKSRENGRALVARPGRHLGDDDLAGGFVDRGQIGERAAHVDPDDEHARDDSIGPQRGGDPWRRAATRSGTSGPT